MRGWTGDELDASDRKATVGQVWPDPIDVEFLPFINRINLLPFVTSVQSCIGHVNYDKFEIPEDERPLGASEKYGYLQLMLTLEAAHWLCQRAVKWHWLWVGGSQLFIDGASNPGVTDNESYYLTFAWDASHWPLPATDITERLEEFYVQRSTRGPESRDQG